MAKFSGSDRPKISELCEYVRIDVAPQWYDLGMQLLNGEQAKKLNVMQSDHPGDSEKCCTAMFNYWLQVDTTASWDKLIMALIHIGKHVLADTIKKMTTEEGTPSESEDDSVRISEVFKEPISITNAYTVLFTQLSNILRYSDLSILKLALTHQACTPDGVELEKPLEKKIKAAKSNSDLLLALRISKCCNWLDTRLIEALAYGSESSNAVELIKAYKKFLFPKKLADVLPKQLKHLETKLAYVKAVTTKTGKDPNLFTIGEFRDYRWTIEDVILDLGKGTLDIEHVNRGCLEISYLMPVHYSFNAYKMALCNRHEFYTIDLLHIEVGDCPLIYDPWLCDLEKHSVKHTLQIHYKISTEICSLLLDKIPVDDLVKLFITHKILTEDDKEVFSLAPSEHLKNQYLLECLWHFKLPVWSVICDILVNTASMTCVGNQVLEVLKDNLPYTVCEHQPLVQDTDSKILCTLHGTRTTKLGFADDSVLFSKLRNDYSKKLLVFTHLFQHVKPINPSEVEKEFHYLSGHVIELLTCCHPELLRKWCENLMASEIHDIKLLPPYSLCKLRQLKTSSAILKMMSMFWSWSNHYILKCLAEFSEIAAALLEDFDSRLYFNFLIIKYPIPLPTTSIVPHNNNSFTVLTLKCNRKLPVTLQEVYDIQSMIIEKCEIIQHALQLITVQSSPLILQWMISKYIVSIIDRNVRKYHNYFATKGITEILVYPNIKHNINDYVKKKPITPDEGVDRHLHEAIRRGDYKTVGILLKAGANVNFVDDFGNASLYNAVCRGDDKILGVLITAGADVNFVNKLGWTSLHMAVIRGHNKIVEALITAGADVNFVDNYGNTSLYGAIRRGYDKIVEVLATAGADVNFVNKYENTPVYQAISLGFDKILEVLIKAGADYGNTPVYEAILLGFDKIVEVLIKAGADVNFVDKYGNTPVYQAISLGFDKILEVLIKAGADWGETPVSIAIRRHHHKVADVLLKSGVHINVDYKKKLEQICESAKEQQQYQGSEYQSGDPFTDIKSLQTGTKFSGALMEDLEGHSQSTMLSSKIKKSEEPTTKAKVGKSSPYYQSKHPFLDIKSFQSMAELSDVVSEDPEETETLSTSGKHFRTKISAEIPDVEEQKPSGSRGNVM